MTDSNTRVQPRWFITTQSGGWTVSAADAAGLCEETQARQALGDAVSASAAADTKAGLLLTATGVLLTGAAVAAAELGTSMTAAPAPLQVLAGVLVAAAAVLVVGVVLALVAVLDVRGGPPAQWLLPGGRSVAEQLPIVVGIVTRKHQLLRWAIRLLAAAVLVGVAACAAGVVAAW